MAGDGLGRRFGWLWAAFAVNTVGTWLASDAFPLVAVIVLVHSGPVAVSVPAASGLAGPDDAEDLPLPDGLHPDAAAHRRIGERFAEHVFVSGAFREDDDARERRRGQGPELAARSG